MAELHTKSADAPAQSAAKAHAGPGKESGKSNGSNGQSWPFAMGQNWPFAVGNIPETMRAQSEAWLSGQADLLAGMQSMMTERMKRYQDGTAAALQSFERLCGCTDGAGALAAYQEWLAGGMGFVMADLEALREQAARMTQMSKRALGAFSPAESAA